MRRETVNVSQLKLSQENPRVGETDSQINSMELIYNSSNEQPQRKSRRQLIKLAESIALNGYQNEVEPIITTESVDNTFVVMDANRRLTAIRLLTAPDKYKDILSASDLSHLKNSPPIQRRRSQHNWKSSFSVLMKMQNFMRFWSVNTVDHSMV